MNNVTVAYRLLPGTIEPPRPVIPQHRSPRPQSNNLQRSTPKTADNSPVALSGVGLANATCSARIDLSAAFESSSQPPLSSCCDDRLNPPTLIVSVADQGEGIAAEHLPRLTERFYRVDTARSRALGGTGLGLAIVKHIVNRHQGRLVIESEVGVGSRFIITLPLADQSRGGNAAVTELQ